jgi:hypothetical protein
MPPPWRASDLDGTADAGTAVEVTSREGADHLDAALRRKTRVALNHTVLHLDGAANGIDDASELKEDSSPVRLTTRP